MDEKPQQDAPALPQGGLTREQSDKAVAWLTEKWSDATPCPFHGPTTWQVNALLGYAPTYVGNKATLGGRVFPFFVVTCGTCGYMVFINALVAGVLSPDQPPESAA